MSKQELDDKEKPIHKFEEFIQYQGLVDWPVTYEEYSEAFVHFFPYKDSEQIYEHFKEQIPFPTDITESFTKDFEKLWIRVQCHDSTMFHAQSKTPADKAFSREQLGPQVEKEQTVMKKQSENVTRALGIKDHTFPRLPGAIAADIPGTESSLHSQSFKVYANCLAQPKFVAFCSASPDSRDVLDDSFNRDLSESIFYWVSGKNSS